MPIPASIHNIGDLLDRAAARQPRKPALRDRGESGYIEWTYEELSEHTYRIARHLLRVGVERGEPVGILLPSCRWWGASFLAIIAADATVIPLDSGLSVPETAAIVESGGLNVLITSELYREKIEQLALAGVEFRHIAFIDTRNRENAFSTQIEQYDPSPFPRKNLRCHDALIIFTSGTTGCPKGVVLTHANLLTDVYDLLGMLEITSQEAFVSILPLNHVFEITGGFLSPLALAATTTYTGSLRPDVILKTAHDSEMTIMMVVPAFLKLFLARVKREGAKRMGKRFAVTLQVCALFRRFGLPLGKLLFSSLHDKLSPRFTAFICGGAPIDPRVVREFADMGVTVLQGYGLTETSAVLCVNTMKHNALGSVGRPLPSVDVRIVPAAASPPGEGELWVRGGMVFRGYLSNAEETGKAFYQDWFRTGDIVRRDRRGYLYVCGRAKNVIVTAGGKNIYPEDVEHVLHQCPLVREACVVGVPDGTGAEKPVAVVTAVKEQSDGSADADAAATLLLRSRQSRDSRLRADVQSLLKSIAEYKRPKELHIWDELPRTSTLKVKRFEVLRILASSGLCQRRDEK